MTTPATPPEAAAAPAAAPPALDPAPPTERRYEYVLLGLLVASAMAGVLVYFVYHGWVTHDIAKSTAYYGIGFPYLGLCLGLFVFAYGWQGADIARAVRMTVWLSLGSLALVALALALLSILKAGASSASEAEEEADARSGNGLAGGIFGRAFNDIDGAAANRTPDSGGWLFGNAYGSSQPPARAAEPGEPLVIHCSYCGERYAPRPPKATCPYCGHSAFAG